ncbi:MAG: hypothetical protein ABIY55_00855 [Kofleriaceae bacterium]
MRSWLVAALVLGPWLARAASASPDDLVARPSVLAPGEVDLRLTAEVTVEYHRATRLISLAPDAWLGVSERWTLGLVHSDVSLDRIGTGASLCVAAGEPCDHLYRGSGVDVRYSALAGDLAVAPRMRALIRDVDPFKPAITLGAFVRWTRGRFAISSDPYVRIPLANSALGNRSALVLPIWLAVQPAAGWLIAAHAGFDADFVVFRDGGHGPFSLVVTTRATAALELTVEAGWGQLFGPQHDAKTGTLLVTAGWRR